ncbi:hypothetical protein DAI22_02g047650 [Oryza sativa Japonica Group]|nr:hypothetical protein DAI22_02g047650 [Oryza sativa Japonica Group]
MSASGCIAPTPTDRTAPPLLLEARVVAVSPQSSPPLPSPLPSPARQQQCCTTTTATAASPPPRRAAPRRHEHQHSNRRRQLRPPRSPPAGEMAACTPYPPRPVDRSTCSSLDPPAPRSRPLCSAFLIQFRRQAGAAAHAAVTSTAEGSASVLVTPASSPALGRPNNSRFRPNIGNEPS